ncbi:MAG: HD domain-containing protein, partial [Candidatus Micrarchaeota archaeon]|nr:HD domain-containing protein [Candidatus Micrarchaeota archaeon]
MDYLLRDARYTGVAYGVIDSDRILNTIRLKGNEIVIDESGVEPAESLLIARHMMFSNVYLHHAVRIASAMLGRAITAAIEGGTLDAAELPEMDDAGLMLELMRNDESAKLAERLRERRLYKRACVVEVKDGKGKTDAVELASRIAKKAGVDEYEVVVDPPSLFAPENAGIMTAEGGRDLGEFSEIVKALRKSEETRRKLIVACPREKVEKVRKACAKIL